MVSPAISLCYVVKIYNEINVVASAGYSF